MDTAPPREETEMGQVGSRRGWRVLLAVAVTASTLVMAPVAPAQTGGTTTTVSVNPTSGPTGTSGTITVSGEPNSAVTLQVGQSSTNGTTDANGTFIHPTTFTGQQGDVVTITATVGTTGQSSGSTTFTITAPPAPKPTASVSVNPGSGPTGTQGTITVKGEPNSTVSLDIGPSVVTGTTDANGTFTHPTTFSGAVGHVIPIKATVGNSTDAATASTSFTITAPGAAFGPENSTAYSAFGDPIGDHLRHHGWKEPQIAIALDRGWNVTGETQMYGFADDPLGAPGVSEQDAAGTVPVRIGYEYVRFTDSALLPPVVDGPTIMDGTLLVPFGNGPLETDRLYAWYWAELKGDVPFDTPGIGLNFAFPTYVRGGNRWESTFPGDSWIGASHIPAFYNDPTAGPLAWFGDLFTVDDGGRLNSYEGPGGLAWVEGNTLGIYVPADAVMGPVAEHIAEYGYAADIVLNPTAQFDPNAPRKVTVYPPNFTATGRDGGLEPVTVHRYPINVGFSATYGDVRDAVVYRDVDDQLWVALYFLDPWPLEDPIGHFLRTYFSFFVGAGLGYGDMFGPFLGTQVHDGVPESFGTGPDGPLTPTGILVMEDGSVRINLGYGFPMLAGETEAFQIDTGGAFWLDEDTTERQSVDRTFDFTIEDVLDEANPPVTGDSFFDGFFEIRPVYDVLTGTQLIDPADLVDEPEVTPILTEPEPEPGTGAGDVTTPAPTEITTTTTEQVPSGEVCWWCWGAVALFLAVLLCLLYIWLKSYDWWTCWLPWFIVIFFWVPFLLAGMWWWRPAWWWVPLLAWFPIIGGYTWYWARHRSWWQPWHLYVVGGYLVGSAVAMLLVGSPEWGLLFPVFWVPWVGFYLWFRGSRQVWFAPWMWLLFAAYVVWMFIWVIALTPWWAWWFPVVFFAGAGWWFVSHGYRWSEIRGPKWCWVLPFSFLPFLAWWIPLWGPWWCFVIIGVLALTLLCAIFNHFKEEEWWTCWLPWFLVIWVGIPFLLAGLWFFAPNWWWLPLLSWFIVIPGYAYWWAQRRGWWEPWHWYVVFGYLAAAAALMYIVGSPTWGLLFPVFWLGPVAFYLWYRPRRQPWFQPWMWGLFIAYVAWVFIWVIWLTPFWGWWFPVFFVPFFGWWGIRHGYEDDVWTRKSCALIPMALLPWLGYMLAIYCIPEYYL